MSLEHANSDFGLVADSLDADRFVGTAVNPRTFLATDYLNHFNEAIMLFEMVVAMPDCVEDLKAWAPKSYEAHFRESVFKDRFLCIEAYAHVAPSIRAELNAVTDRLNAGIAAAVEAVDAAIAAGDFDILAVVCGDQTASLCALVDHASGIINGAADVAEPNPSSVEHIDTTQAAIDALFD